MSAFNNSCLQPRNDDSQPNSETRIIRIQGNAITIADGSYLCHNLGNGYKLLELHRKEDVTQFISLAHKEKFSTPAAIFYDVRIHKFVYFSTNRPVTKQSAIYRFQGGDTIESYNYWDSYSDYFGQYVVDNSQVYIDVAPSETTYDHVYCMTPAREDHSKNRMISCLQDYEFISDISLTTINQVNRLNTFLADTWGARQTVESKRGKRGIAMGAIISAALGGTAGVITTKLISAVNPDEDLRDALTKTEEALDSMKERTNLLDINQKRIMTLIEESQRQLGDLAWEKSEEHRRNSIHIQINSLLMHVKDHLDYLGYLLSSREHIGAYNIALDNQEREVVLQRITNGTNLGKRAGDSSLGYRFKMLEPHSLCIVIDIPLQPPLRTIAAVRPYPFPSIVKGKLATPKSEPRPFLQFHGSFFVMLDQHTFQGCIKYGFCEGPKVPEIADDQANCAMHQFFHNASAGCPQEIIQDKRFLLYAGSSLFYSTVQSLQIQFQCKNQEEEEIRNIKGKGLLETPESCQILSSKAIFPKPKPSKKFVLANQSQWPTLNVSGKILKSLSDGRGSKLQKERQMPKLDLVKIPPFSGQHDNKGDLVWTEYLNRINKTIFLIICALVCLTGVYLIMKRRSRQTSAVDL